MKKDKSIQTDIEVLKGIVTDWMEAKQSRQNALAEIDPVLGGTEIVLYEIEIERDERNIKTLQRTISALEAMRDKPEMKSAGRTVCKKCNEIFQPILNKALEENKELRKRLDDWIYELAYYTEDEVATPKGVKKFIGKAIEDKVKEIKELREEIKDRAGTEKSLTAWVNELGEENDSLKLAQPNALKASEVKPKPLSKLTLKEFITIACEYTPSIAKDSGQPEWNNGELIELFNALTEGHWLYITE